MRFFFLIILITLSFNAQNAFASKDSDPEYHSLVQQPRTLAMGGAGVGLADDEYALFQNVAGLAGNNKRELKLLGLGVEASWDVYTTFSESTSAMKKFSIDTMNALMGKNIFMRGGLTPIFTLKHFAIAYVLDGQFSMTQFNRANPEYHMGSMITQGVQAGYGWKIGQGKRPVDEWRFGLGAKILWRKGGYNDLTTVDLLEASRNSKTYLNDLMGPYSIGAGFDAGTQYIFHLDQRSDLMAGMSFTDIGGTHFKSAKAMEIPMNWSVGLGYKSKIEPFKLAVGLDYRNILEEVGFTNHLHFGVDVGMPFFDIYAGLSQMYVSYGFAFDLWITKISFTSYEEEMGYTFQQNGSRRYLFQVDFKLPI